MWDYRIEVTGKLTMLLLNDGTRRSGRIAYSPLFVYSYLSAGSDWDPGMPLIPICLKNFFGLANMICYPLE